MKYINIPIISLYMIISFLFFLFEDLIWNKLSKKFLNNNIYLKMYLFFMNEQNKYLILFNFTFLFIFAELFGFYSIYSTFKGFYILGISFYFFKVFLSIIVFNVLKTYKNILYTIPIFKILYSILNTLNKHILNHQNYTLQFKIYTYIRKKIKDLKKILKLKLFLSIKKIAQQLF